jgi:hypothetical protein
MSSQRERGFQVPTVRTKSLESREFSRRTNTSSMTVVGGSNYSVLFKID